MTTRIHPTLRAVAAATLMLGALGAQAQDKPVEMKFAHWLPAMHPLAKLGFEPWAKSVEAASKGSIKVALFPAQQLGNGGRLIMPVGPDREQQLVRLTRRGETFEREVLGPATFVPLLQGLS